MYCSHCMTLLHDHADFCHNCHHNPSSQAVLHHLAVGTILNHRYLIGEAIGEGGFGITYIAFDTNLELKVAVKEFYPNGYANRINTVTNDVTLNYTEEMSFFDHAKERFLQEAKRLAKFSNESAVVNVRDYFTEHNTAYIVMEYVEGVTLQKYLKQNGTFVADDLFKRMLPLMDVLSVMHRASIIHRDISPDNIMVTPNGSFKLMDFGSARYYRGNEKRTMAVLLKPSFAPIEQYSQDGKQGPWTDVYGLCATIYRCITGKMPPDAMLRCQRDALQKPSESGVQISPVLENVLMHGLRVFSQDRLQDMPALKAAVLAALSDRSYVDDKGETRFQGLTYGDRYTVGHTEENKDGKYSGVKPAVLIAVVVFLLIAAGVIVVMIAFPKSDGAKSSSGNGVVTSATGQIETQTTTQIETDEMTDSEENAEESAYHADTVILPDVVGNKFSEAEEKLSKLGIKTAVSYETSDSVAEGYIIRQSIAPGKSLEQGSTLLLYVSSGKPADPPAQQETDAEANENPPGNQTVHTPATPYLVKVFPDTYVYESPSADATIVMTLTEENVYTIVEETIDSYGRWGRLKSGVGWVCISDIFDSGGYVVTR